MLVASTNELPEPKADFFNLKCKSLNSHFASISSFYRFHARLLMACCILGSNSLHTVIIAMTSCNDVIAIFLFGVLTGILFSTGNLTHQLLQGPVGIVMGCVFGALSGLLVIKLPAREAVRTMPLSNLSFKCSQNAFIEFLSSEGRKTFYLREQIFRCLKLYRLFSHFSFVSTEIL